MSEPKKKLLFIINPISGARGKIPLERIIPKVLSDDLFDWDLYFTTGRGDATQKSKEAIGSYDIVVAVGGDGTINEVAQGLVHSYTPMAVIPNGSGNGFANYFGISKNPNKALERLIAPKISLIDTGLLNNQLFLSVAGLGFDAKVADAFDRFGNRGFASYAKITCREFANYLPSTYEIIVDGVRIVRKAFLITAANGTQFGNNAYIAPNARIDDGLIDLVIIKPVKWYHLISLTTRLFNKTIEKSSLCEVIKGKKITIKSTDVTAHLDGEPIAVSNTIKIQIQPHSLSMVI